ncbi:MAG TPA: ferrochelatase [Verrucomicrobiae bacterium]|jgi:ferrochelatase|nr:ferrochelatase [Verrucomicrobiae bacterium]
MQQGLLLVNLGSPDSPSVPDVRRYLREFLMDKRVIDAPYPVRFGIVHFGILPKRPHQSSEAYQSIWTAAGSPLVVTSRRLQDVLRHNLGIPVELAMRYQSPSVEHAVNSLVTRGVREIILFPLFPHYAMSSYETAIEKVRSVVSKQRERISLKVIEPFYSDPGYISALVDSAEPFLAREFDHLLFSFHGLPERHLRKSDPTRCHCLKSQNCCEVPSPAHKTCYRAQTLQTARLFAEAAGLPRGKYSIAFQSRLGRDPWMQPYTDYELERLAKAGVSKLLVICPAFVTDCLETLEEIGIRGRETFSRAGGAELTLIPCLNNHPSWIRTVQKIVNRFLRPVEKEPILRAKAA